MSFTAITASIILTASTLVQFDNFLAANYDSIYGKAKRACNNEISFEDILQDKIIACRKRIINNQLVLNFDSFLLTAVKNQYLTNKRLSKPVVDLTYIDFQEEDETIEEDETRSNLEYLFQYCSKYYDEKMNSLFELYHLRGYNTYSKIVKDNNYSMRYVKFILSRMKKDLRLNIKNYIKYQKATEFWRIENKNFDQYKISNKGRVIDIHNNVLQPVLVDQTECYELLNNKGELRTISVEQLQKRIFKENEIILFTRIES